MLCRNLELTSTNFSHQVRRGERKVAVHEVVSSWYLGKSNTCHEGLAENSTASKAEAASPSQNDIPVYLRYGGDRKQGLPHGIWQRRHGGREGSPQCDGPRPPAPGCPTPSFSPPGSLSPCPPPLSLPDFSPWLHLTGPLIPCRHQQRVKPPPQSNPPDDRHR